MGFFFKGLVGSLGDSQFAHTFYLFSQESSIARISKWTSGSGNNFYSGGGTGNSCTVQKRVWKIGVWVFIGVWACPRRHILLESSITSVAKLCFVSMIDFFNL